VSPAEVELVQAGLGAVGGEGRRMIDLLLDPAEHTGVVAGEQALTLPVCHVMSAHAYVTLYRDGLFGRRRPVAARALDPLSATNC
jgi:hypothetical protein